MYIKYFIILFEASLTQSLVIQIRFARKLEIEISNTIDFPCFF